MRPIESLSHAPRPWARLPFARHPVRAAQRDQHQVEAQQRTGRVLVGLPASEWGVVSEFESRSGTTSHVVVGRGGVYLIVGRKPDGCVRVKDGVPWSRGPDSRAERAHTDINRKALEPAQALERKIRDYCSRRPAVHPVVVLWSEFPQRVAETSRVTFVHGRDLASWLRGRHSELDEAARAEVAEAVEHIAEADAGRMRRAASRQLRAA